MEGVRDREFDYGRPTRKAETAGQSAGLPG
jgi:hypothetical protein